MIKLFTQFINENDNSDILYHATNTTWSEPEIKGLGFHAGTLKAAKDRMKSFRFNINPHIKMYKDHIISKDEKNEFIRIYDEYATFKNLRKLLHDKYGYDGFIYRNNIEDRGSDSYAAFFPEQIEFLGNYEEPKSGRNV